MTPVRFVRRALAFFAAALSACTTPRDATTAETVVRVQARRFEFSPARIRVRASVPTTLELASLDVVHGFSIPELGVRAELVSGHPARVRVLSDRPGELAFHCDVFCGDGHEDMAGVVEVTP
ncbi:MAG TPA: cupredoxin domain-containing protein [Polyangiaceae bacterium]|nr:cupredoxin domain-containing protein [Polyangiaceae bacterium]